MTQKSTIKKRDGIGITRKTIEKIICERHL